MEVINEKESILDNKVINLNLNATTKEEVIREMATMLYEENYVMDLDGFIEDVYEREQEGITGMGNNVAIPHGKSDSVLKAGIAIGKTASLVEWESYDEQPVNLFFLFAVPSDVEGAKLHLRLLSKVAVRLSDDELLEQIKKTCSSEEVVNLLNI